MLSTPPDTGPDELDVWLHRTSQLVGVAVTLYLAWQLVPESAKLELRRWAGIARVPFDAEAAAKAARADMMRDVIELMTYGVPDTWGAPA